MKPSNPGMDENQRRKWVWEFTSGPARAFPEQGQMRPEQLEIERPRREMAKLGAKRDIPKTGEARSNAFFAREAA